MIKQECIGIPDMILLLMIFCFKKIKIKAEIVLSPGGAYFSNWKHYEKRKKDHQLEGKIFAKENSAKVHNSNEILKEAKRD